LKDGNVYGENVRIMLAYGRCRSEISGFVVRVGEIGVWKREGERGG
jgi:hypothetical protein